MNDYNENRPRLTPEREERGRAAIARMLQRRRDGDYRDPPIDPDKLESMAPGITVEPSSPARPRSGRIPEEANDDDG